MLETSQQTVPAFNTIQDELNFWKESYNEAQEENRELKEKLQQMQYCQKVDAKDETDEPPTKRLRIDESMDPLIKLKADGFFEVMKRLSGKELRTSMEVSKSWKSFISSKKLLMDRAINRGIAKPNVEGCSLPMVMSLFSETSEKKAYENMETPIELAFVEKVSPVVRYAATLKTLVVEPERYDESAWLKEEKIDFEGCEFPQLQTLTIRGHGMDFYKRSSFPAVTELKLHNVKDGDKHCKEMQEWMRNFPKLKNLEIKSNSGFWSMETYPDDPIEDDPLQPKIETLTIPYYEHDLFRAQQHSLTDLKINGSSVAGIDTVQLSLVLRNLKNLKILDIRRLRPKSDSTSNFPRNNSIEIFKLRLIEDSTHDDADVNVSEVLQNILLALPSLKEFTLVFGTSSELLQFLANNMVNLKKLFYNRLQSGARETYQEIRNNHHRYLNGDFLMIFHVPESVD